MTEHSVTSADGVRIAASRSGSGPPLVLVHGTSVEHFSFRLVEPLLSQHFTVYAVDRRGRGKSGDSADGYAIEQEFADIAAVVDSLSEPVALLGHSYGATVALGTAPLTENLGRLILYEPAPGIPQESPQLLAELDELLALGDREGLLSTFLLGVGIDADGLEQMKTSPVWPGRVAAAHTIARELRAEESYTPEPADFTGVTAPALLLLGSESPIWAKEGTEIARSVLGDSSVAILEGEGHLAILTAPEVFVDEVLRFLG